MRIYPELMALVQHHPEEAPLIEAILTKLRVIGAALAGRRARRGRQAGTQ